MDCQSFQILRHATSDRNMVQTATCSVVLYASATAAKLFPMPISGLGGWHPDAYRAIGTIAVKIASRTLTSLHYARATLFQRHDAPLAVKSAVCLMSGFDFEV